MIRTKHISLDDDCLKRIEPFIHKHGGNFSAAIREMVERAEETLPNDSIVIDGALFDWLLNETCGRLIPDNILDVIIDPSLKYNIDDISKFINHRMNEFGWKVNINIDCDDISSPSSIIIQAIGTSHKTRLIAHMISQFIIKNSINSTYFAVKSIINLDSETKVWLTKVTNKKEGTNSLISFFGNLEEVEKAIKNRPTFWKCIVNRHVISNYQMVTVHRNYYEDILVGKTPIGEIMIEIIAKKPIRHIPPKEMLDLIKKVYEASRIVDKVEIQNDTIILFHTYRNNGVLEKIKRQLIMLLEINGHMYDGEITTNMIVLRHRPDIGIKIDEIVNNLKSSESKFDQELITFMTFLKGLDNITDTTTSISILGRRIGTVLMEEYGKENSIKVWDLETFQKAFTTIDSKIHRDGELKLDGNNLLYKIRKCNIVSERDTFGTYICEAAKEAFKGAINYAFGNNVELDILSHEDNYCEVVIKI